MCGEPTSGPGEAWAGSNVIGTKLGGTYTSNRNWSTSFAQSPVYDLEGLRRPEVTFRMWFQTEQCCDGMNLKASVDGGPWQVMGMVSPSYTRVINSQSAWSGSSANWVQVAADLTQWKGRTVQFRLDFRTDGSAVQDGFYIDDFTISH